MAVYDQKITVESPFVRTVDPTRYAKDPFWQHQLVEHAISTAMSAPFEANIDLRGSKITLEVHDDGLHVTVTVARA